MAARGLTAAPSGRAARAARDKFNFMAGSMGYGSMDFDMDRAHGGDEKQAAAGGTADDETEGFAEEGNKVGGSQDRGAEVAAAEAEPKKKLSYPKSVFFILGNEFCERFSFYGMRTVLTLYLRDKLMFNEHDSTAIMHTFMMLAYFFPLFGAIIADSWLGKFKTILYLSVLYALGNITLSLGAIPIAGVPRSIVSLLGLLIIAIGTGGIKPCVSAFGGDQFVLPDQELQLQHFFAIFYLAINIGSLISSYLTPIFRAMHCFGEDSCYSLAFGVPALFMTIALIIFIFGKRFYMIRKPEGNVVVQVGQCIGHAISNRRKGKDPSKSSWLDYADDKYDRAYIDDVKGVLSVLMLYLPLPIFWALFDQQASRWTFQADRMDGYITSGFIILPEQIQLLNPLLVFALIPLFETLLYPLCYKIGILRRPLQKMVLGMVVAGAAFFVSGIVELQLGNNIQPAQGYTRLTLANALDCPVTLNAPRIGRSQLTIPVRGKYELNDVPANTEVAFNFLKASCLEQSKLKPTHISSGRSGETYSVIIHADGLTRSASKRRYSMRKSHGRPLVRLTHGAMPPGTTVTFRGPKAFILLPGTGSSSTGYYEQTVPGRYTVWVNDSLASEEPLDFSTGGTYEVALTQKGDKYAVSSYVDTQPRPLHMLWQIPQYFLITVGEILFSPTGLEFSFTQSPVSMKSVVQSAWLLTIATGNVIVIFIAELKLFQEQYAEFFFFGAAIWFFAAIFSLMAWRCFKYRKYGFEDARKTDNRMSIASVMGQETAISDDSSRRRTNRTSEAR